MGKLFERSMAVPATLEALRVRHGLLERLSQLQRSISHGAPLQDVFGAIAAGASELLGDPVAGLRLVDEHDPTTMRLVATTGLRPDQLDLVRVGAVGEGAGGRAISEGRVVVVEDYPESDGIARFGEFGVQNAIAAPVRVNGGVVGSLTVASFEAGRRYDLVEQEILSALAEHAGLALLDASLIDQRERDVQREGEERFQALVRHSSDLIAIVDPEGVIAFATPSVGRVLGRDAAELPGTPLLTHVHPADRPQAARLLQAAAAAPGTQPPSDWRLVPEGAHLEHRRWMHVEVLATNLLDHPNVGGIVVNARDVTERVVAERRRREQDALYRTIVDTTHDGVWMTDRDDRTVFVNDGLAAMLGRAPEELAGRRPAEFMAPDQAQIVEAATRRRREGVSERYEAVMLRGDGSPLRMTISATPVYEDSRFSGSLALCADITELTEARDENTRLEARLRHAQELETLGRLAGHVAHDFNQVLAVVQGYADLLRGRAAGERDREDLGRIAEAAEHGAALARQLVSFSRRDEGEPEIVDVAEFVRSIGALVSRTIPPGVTVTADAAGALPACVDPTKLRQVLMNLVDNAVEALEGSGSVRLGARLVDLPGSDPALAAGPYVELSVADDGRGMEPHVAARALEPAFTTKARGTGLGLAIVHGAVETAGGRVSLASRPGNGTTVTVHLPAVRPPSAPVAPPAAPPAAPPREGRRGRILLVDDDAAVLGLIRRVLAANGYVVHACDEPSRALEVARREPIDLLLTDQAMPGGSGVELAARIGELRPGTPAIVMSGYASDAAASRPGDVGWLSKPFGADALLGSVRAALARA